MTRVFLQPGVRQIGRILDMWRGSPRNSETRGESESCGLAGCVVTKGLLSKVIEKSSLSVAFELVVPRLPIVFEEPSSKLRKFRWRERLDLLLDSLDLAQDLQVVPQSIIPSRTGWAARAMSTVAARSPTPGMFAPTPTALDQSGCSGLPVPREVLCRTAR